MNTVWLPVLALGWLWPFGDGGDKQDDGTIKSVEANPVEIETDAEIDGGSQKAMEHYRLFLDLVSDDPLLRAEAMRRLADLQLEASEEAQLSEDLARIEAAGQDDASNLYQKLLESYPDYEKSDLVLYQLARAYESTGQGERALEVLDRLVREFPATEHVDEAHFRRGEILFVLKRYDEAEEAYDQVLGRGEGSQFYLQSMYKHGWSAFKQSQHEKGIHSFLDLLDRKLVAPQRAPAVVADSVATDDAQALAPVQSAVPSRSDASGAGAAGPGPKVDPIRGDSSELMTGMGRAERELIKDTFRVLSISFSYLDGPASIDDYFDQRGMPHYAYVIYTNLGDLYISKERFTDAAEAYHAFVEHDPYHAKAPLLQAEVIEAYKQGEFDSLVLDGKQDFVRRYGLDSPYWERHAVARQPLVVGLLKSNLKDLARHFHALAQASKKPQDYALAAEWYQSYLDYFPDDPNAAGMNFLLAEILFDSGQFQRATEEYERTAYAYLPHDKAAEAGYAALLAYRRHETSLSEPQQSQWHAQGVESALQFGKTYPGHEHAAAVLTNASEELFKANQLERAIEVAMTVVQRDPPPPAELQRTAWTVSAHSQFDLAAFAAAESAYLNLQRLTPGDDSKQSEITERIASSIYKQGEQQKQAGNLAGAVAHFRRVGQAAPGSGIVVTADYDAAAVLVQMKDWSQAATVIEGFRRDHPSLNGIQASQQKLPESQHLFDDAKDRVTCCSTIRWLSTSTPACAL